MMNQCMVVDDDAFIRSHMKRILGDYAHVILASCGNEGLLFYENYRPPLVFLDFHLPDIDGLQVLHALHERHADVYCVIITGDATSDVVMASKFEGARGFLAKPFIKQALVRHVAACPAFAWDDNILRQQKA